MAPACCMCRRNATLPGRAPWGGPALYAAQQPHVLGAVAGRIDDGEDPESSARRETVEEAGLELHTLERVARAWPMPGVSTEQMDLFLAEYSEADRVSAGGGAGGE